MKKNLRQSLQTRYIGRIDKHVPINPESVCKIALRITNAYFYIHIYGCKETAELETTGQTGGQTYFDHSVKETCFHRSIRQVNFYHSVRQTDNQIRKYLRNLHTKCIFLHPYICIHTDASNMRKNLGQPVQNHYIRRMDKHTSIVIAPFH